MTLANAVNEQEKLPQNFSVETVRNFLKLDNKGIAKLCAEVSLMPKKDRHGRTYFSKDDVDVLKRMHSLHQKAAASKVSVPVKPAASSKVTKEPKQPQLAQKLPALQEAVVKKIEKLTENSPMFPPMPKPSANTERILTSIDRLEDNLTQKLTKIIDEKLDGMDEVVVELVRCKTENETLRYKLNELNKENYNLKNELSQYKEVGFGFYLKKSGGSLL
ncbi:TPA: hypothetical protein IAD52_07755 [Candidatus Spyradomonas excrementavium]|nr:hypothetical protein [Candidatus Spyradomonas excrementavium]